ncbi:hypothetical protein BDW62DRAFT_205535 [Aspergillus aurantiobrunneus]
MVSLRSLLGPSTALIRQFLPRHNTDPRVLARPFSQLSQLTINNGLRLLRSGKESSKSASVGVGAVSGVRQLEQVRGMKTRSSVKRLCEGCKLEEPET